MSDPVLTKLVRDYRSRVDMRLRRESPGALPGRIAFRDRSGTEFAGADYTPRSATPPEFADAMRDQGVSEGFWGDHEAVSNVKVTELAPPPGTLPEELERAQPIDKKREIVGYRKDGRPILQNDDGSVSTERSITVTNRHLNGGRPTNIPSIWNGREYGEGAAIGFALHSGQKFDSFDDIDAALKAAKSRTEGLGHTMQDMGLGGAAPGAAAPVKPAADWQEREAGLLPERLADPVGIYDDAGAAGAGEEIAPGAWSAYQTLKADDDSATRAKGVLSRMGDPAAQDAYTQQVDGARLHLASQARPDLVEQARRAMGLAVPSARPGKAAGHYPQAAADPAGSNYGTGMEGMVGKGMVAYSGNTKATPEEIAEDFTVSAQNGKPDSALNVYQQRPEKDAAAGQVNARLMEAAKKSAIVALGADPRNTFYTKEAARDAVGGAYGRTLGGKMQANVHSPATAAHESIHNGVERLLKDPELPARFKKQLGDHKQQEFITRMLMLKNFGEAESEGEQSLGFKGNHPQIVKAREMLADPKWQQWSDDLEAYAARKVASDRPGGPR